MTIAANLLAGIFFSVLLVKAAAWIITSTSRLARHLRVSEYIVSFLIVGLATSLPELLVGVIAALDKKPALSYGNVLGSNIADLTVILAIPILVGGAISTRQLIKNKDIFYAVFFGLLPPILIFDGFLSKFDGLILILSYVFYLTLVLKRSSSIQSIIDNFHHTHILKDLVVFISSAVLLLVSANLLVTVAENLSIVAKIPLIFVGLTVTALGTSLPELAFGLKAIKTNHKGEVLGNILGSTVANSTLILGLTALIYPIRKDGSIGLSSVGFLILVLALFLVFSIKNGNIDRLEAAILGVVYMVFVVVERILVM